MNKEHLIAIFLFFPVLLFSQKFKVEEIKPFIDFENEKYSIVIESLDNLIKNNPKPEFYKLLAETYYKLEDYENALALCDKLDKLKPNYASCLRLRIYLEKGDKNRLKEVLNKNLNSFYKIPLYEILRSEEFALLSNYDLDNYVLSSGYYSQTEKQLYQVERLIYEKNNKQALFITDEIIARNWNVSDAHYFKSLILLIEKDIQGAKREINLAISLKKSEPKYYIQRISVFNELHNYELALSDMNRLIRLNPYEIDHYIQKADLLFKTEYYDEAQKLSASILEVKPNNPDVLYLNSKAYFRNKDYHTALKQINRAFEHKSNKEFFELRGDIYFATDTYQYAVQDYSMFLDIYPRSGDVYNKKGMARYNLGDKKGACYDWERGKRYGSYEAVENFELYCLD